MKLFTKEALQNYWMKQANQQFILINHTLVQLYNQQLTTQFI